jgi:hypothetical protein
MDVRQPTSFFHLPLELREQIYESALDHIPLELPINKLSPSLQLPSLAFVNSHTLDESLAVYMRRRTLLLDEGGDTGDAPARRLTKLLERLPPKASAFAKVRNITISRPQLVYSAAPTDWISRRKTHYTTQRLVSRCPNLRTLSFTVHAGTVLDLGSGAPRIKTADQIERKFRFKPLVDHQSLRDFRILGVGGELYAEQLKLRPDEIFQALADMLAGWFRGRGKNINIQVVPISLNAQWFQQGCSVDEKGRDLLVQM